MVGNASNILLLIKLAKRRGDNYGDMNIIRFRHCTSGLTRVSKLDIMTSQMHRFRYHLMFMAYNKFAISLQKSV